MPITKHEFAEADVAALKKAFDVFDEDRSGTIDSKELQSVLQSLGRTATEAEIVAMIASVDAANTGTISFPDFLLLMWKRKVELQQLELYRSAFRAFNVSGSGKMTSAELRNLMAQLGQRVTDEELDEMVFEADEDNDQLLVFEEFLNIIQRCKHDDATTRRGWAPEHNQAIENWKSVVREIGNVVQQRSAALKAVKPTRAFRPLTFRDAKTKRENSRVLQPVLAQCREGDTILLDPGKYNEPFVIQQEGLTVGAWVDFATRPEEVSEDAFVKQKRAAVIVEVNSPLPAVTLKARQCKIENLTIINREGPAIAVELGYADIINCDISGALGGIVVRNRSFPSIQRCIIQNCTKAFGMELKESRAIVEDCIIRRNYDAGVVADRSSNPWIHRCQILDGQGSGMVFDEGAIGVVSECEIRGNATQGILIQHAANPVVWKCDVSKGHASGVRVNEGGRGSISDCTFSFNDDHDIDISKEGNPIVVHNQFKGGNNTAVSIYNRGLGVLENNEFQDYQLCGVSITNGCHVTLQQNVFRTSSKTDKGGGMHGIFVEGECSGKASDNMFIGWKPGYSNGRAAFHIGNSTHFLSINNVVQENDAAAETESIVNLLGGGMAKRQSIR